MFVSLYLFLLSLWLVSLCQFRGDRKNEGRNASVVVSQKNPVRTGKMTRFRQHWLQRKTIQKDGHLWVLSPARFWTFGTEVRRDFTRTGDFFPGVQDPGVRPPAPLIEPIQRAADGSPATRSGPGRYAHRMPQYRPDAARGGRGGAGGSRGIVEFFLL